MIECNEFKALTRRAFLRKAGAGLGAIALADPLLHNVATTFAQSAGGSGNLLVLCQLRGGLDALSFLAPFKNSVYQTNRPQLALTADQVTPTITGSDYGINNLFPYFSELFTSGQLAIVQQVGYPDANGSHFESQEIYEFGVRDLGSGPGTAAPWYERLRMEYFDEPFGVLDTERIGDPNRFGYPDSTYRQAAQTAFARLASLEKSDDATHKAIRAAYRDIDALAETIRSSTEGFESIGEARGDFHRAAMLASADLGTQIIKVNYGGYDTHGSQASANETLFPRLNDEFQQFVGDLQAMGMWDRTTICFYSEFGRRNAENASPGTDHGHGGHMILAGPGVRGGLHGQAVTSADLKDRSLPHYVDFRAVFGACMRDWLGFDPRPVFNIGGETYDEHTGSDLFK